VIRYRHDKGLLPMNADSKNPADSIAPKKAYVSPVLHVYGSVQAMTQIIGINGGLDTATITPLIRTQI